IRIGPGRPIPVTAWAGPWPVHERWWDNAAKRDRVRLQVICGDDQAYLVSFEQDCWWLEASYD
ncbi:MAG: DNA polymerase Y family protein, partial [Actinomycetota bacterium]|nr:DNA polymerase Y family protein [Actinomycetota bacterium]